MSPSAVNHRWMLLLKIFVLFSVIVLQNHFCKASSTKKRHRLKNILFVSAEKLPVDPHFPSDVVFKEENGTHLCFNIQANQSNADCCGIEDFNCGTKIVRLSDSTYSLTVSREILLKHDIVVLLNPMSNFSCMFSQLHNSTEFILDLDNCLKPGGRNVRITLDHLYQNQYNDVQTCEGSVKYKFKFGSKITSIVKIISCESPVSAGVQQPLNLIFPYTNYVATFQGAVNIMNDFSFYQDQMEAFTTAFIKLGNVTGAIAKLQPQGQNQTALNFGFTASGDVRETNNVNVKLDLQIQISKEANELAAKRNSKYIGVLLFPGMPEEFLNNKMFGIEMGASISDLSQAINIHYSNVNTTHYGASCVSWDGKGNQTWTADGCQTNQTNGYVNCRCSHNTFIAVVMTLKPEMTFTKNSSCVDPKDAVQIMFDLNGYIYNMTEKNVSTAAIKIGNITGVIAKLSPNPAVMNFGFTSSKDVNILGQNYNAKKIFATEIHLPTEAIDMALAQNENYIRILIFPGVFKNDNDSSVLHGEVLGIEMGSKISNLSKPIDIQYNNATLVKSGLTPKCVSWDNNKRNGNEPNWTTDGCTTIKNSDNVKCQCSHLTFFGILLSSVPLIEDGKPEKLLTFEAPKTPLDSDQAVKFMKNLSFILDFMGNSSSAAIKMGNITGVMSRLPKQNQTVMDFGFQSSGDVMILKENNNGVTNIKQTIHFPKKAIKLAVEQNGSFAGVFLFPEIEKLNKTSSFFNNEIMGVEMGVNISNLSETIDIHFTDVNTTEFNAICVSWDGTSKEEGGKNKWITDGCLTNETNGSITCQCSHLTFFGILLSSVPLVEDGKPEKLLTFEAPKTPLDSDQAAKLMKNLSFILDLMGNSSSAAIKMGNITGVMSRLPKQNQTVMDFGFQSSGDVMILKENNNGVTNIKQTIHFPKKASKSAVEQNGSFAGVFLFPEIEKLNKTSSFFNNEMMGVEMGVSISNLSETIDIHFTDVNTTEFNATCVSWDGTSKEEGGKNKWITDGCLTNEANGSITCQCSHLTFFAILMSTDVQISSSDLKTLTQITKAGCGISLFFLGVALFMHFLIRKTKASESVKILMNLFVALFFLNLCFLVNESIAKLKVSAACVAMAAALHYSMLATFTWFFMQALHLYFNLHQISTGIKYYMGKICITGWVVPAVVVVGLLASSKYDYIDISDNNGTSVTMCWIPDYATHLVVNISYYGIVFIFTLTIFVVTVVQIKHFTPKEAKTQESTKKRVFSLLGLFCLLGITWGFAFFSYGPLLLPSYYIFTVLNSFQGFFLFVYYYFSSRILPEVSKQTKSSNQTSETVSKSPYG